MLEYESAMGWVDDLFHLFGREAPPDLGLYIALTIIVLPLPIVFFFIASARPRFAEVPVYRERVLILGASSGVGEQLALQYAARGCRNLVLVARRGAELERVRDECVEKRKEGEEWDQAQQAPGWEEVRDAVTLIEADCAKAEDLVKIRQTVRRVLGGIDTIHIVFGVSALRSLLDIAGVDPLTIGEKKASSTPHATLEGIQAALTATSRIHDVNVASTAAVLAAFVPLLQLSSPAPAITLLSSVAAFVPPPTRSLYGASKAAQLQLFQSVAIESAAQAEASPPAPSSAHRQKVRFLAVAPATIRTAFRQSAIDGPVSAATKDSAWDDAAGSKGKPSSSEILEPSQVAHAAIRATDRYETGVRAMPGKYRLVRYAYPFVSGFIDSKARAKYGY